MSSKEWRRELLGTSSRALRQSSDDEAAPTSPQVEPGKITTRDLRAHPDLVQAVTAEPGKLTLEDVDRPWNPAEALRYATRCAGAGGPRIHRDAEPGRADLDQGLLASAFAWIEEARSAQPLPASLQRALGAELGVDLSRVRVHTDTAAAEAAAALGARAFTRGEDIYFAAGAYRPGDVAGVRLIAHEVAHVAQSHRGEVPSGASPVSRPDDTHERDAEAFAGRFEPDRAREPAPANSDATAPTSIAGTLPIARSSDDWQERRDAADENAAEWMREIPGGATVTFTGKGATPNFSIENIDASELPTLTDLLTSLGHHRAHERDLAFAAFVSVAELSEILPMWITETKESFEIELPASYVKAPPTDEVAVFVALHLSTALVEELIRRKQRHKHEVAEGVYDDDTFVHTADEHDEQRWADLAVAMLDGLTANFGGTIGFAVASLLTSDPDRIAAATAFGATAGDAIGATGTVGPKKPGKPKQQSRKGAKKGGKKKAPAAGKGTAPAKAKAKPVSLPSWKKLTVDWNEVLSGHRKGGDRIASGKKGTVFPDTMSENEVKGAVQAAYTTAKVVQTQGDRVRVQGTFEGKTIEMWINKSTKTLETAYPQGWGYRSNEP